MNTATNTTTGQTHTFNCDLETFATYLADTYYVSAEYSNTGNRCVDHNGTATTYTIS